MAKKSFWQRGEDHAKKVTGEIIEQIERGEAPWQKPWKPGGLLEPITVDVPFYLGRLKRPESKKKPERSDG